jgi:pyruvate/2-oxoglutarate dehydrogenase complex dihydrolipoamide acyltransferase (E2) component
MSGETATVTVDAGAVWPDDALEEEGVVSNWFVRAGTTVEVGETLCEVQVEKVAVDVDSPAAGTVAALLVDEREPITSETPLATVSVA